MTFYLSLIPVSYKVNRGTLLTILKLDINFNGNNTIKFGYEFFYYLRRNEFFFFLGGGGGGKEKGSLVQRVEDVNQVMR